MKNFRKRLARLRPRSLGLQARITGTFALGALLLSVLLAGITFALTRANLLSQRESAVLSRVYVDANVVRNGLPGRDPDHIQDQFLPSLQLPAGSKPLLHYRDKWFFSVTAALKDENVIPESLRTTVSGDHAARMTFSLQGKPALAVGIPLRSVNAEYFEIVELDDLQRTLGSLAISLLGASVLTTLAGAGIGFWAGRRALRPLADVSQAAEAIAGGRLDTRLEATDDPHLGVLATSFNEMAQALQDRIERDARFASDVSHELRSPLMTLSASVDVLETRRDELSERSQAALDLLAAEVGRFSQLVEDLLEISRYDAGAVRLELDEIRLVEFVMQAVRASGNGTNVPVELDSELASVVVQADKRRLARVVANLLDNAQKYAEGATSVTLRRVDDCVQIAVEDDGPGIPDDERSIVFERFARGGGAGRRGSGEGVGLGLALVAEHVRLHGGRVWVEDRGAGEAGARFVIELPVLPT
ncbi:MAG: two-component system, OmpR family, sensor histidine kinase MtrB [Pseudonocardiales bacterium]|nr:two-component system, OmpR family, sensor histidine kinase MtrB [Pseudonocardiales bacterium]